MSTTLWNCETCNKSMNRTSKSRHLKSQAHIKKTSGIPTVSTTKDCDLCYESQPTKKFKKCTQCVNSWCKACHQKMDKCPFCRVEIEGAQRRPYVWNPTPEEFPTFYTNFNPEPVTDLEDEISRFYASFAPEPLHVRPNNQDFIQWVADTDYNEDFERRMDEMLDYYYLAEEPVFHQWRMNVFV